MARIMITVLLEMMNIKLHMESIQLLSFPEHVIVHKHSNELQVYTATIGTHHISVVGSKFSYFVPNDV